MIPQWFMQINILNFHHLRPRCHNFQISQHAKSITNQTQNKNSFQWKMNSIPWTFQSVVVPPYLQIIHLHFVKLPAARCTEFRSIWLILIRLIRVWFFLLGNTTKSISKYKCKWNFICSVGKCAYFIIYSALTLQSASRIIEAMRRGWLFCSVYREYVCLV